MGIIGHVSVSGNAFLWDRRCFIKPAVPVRPQLERRRDGIWGEMNGRIRHSLTFRVAASIGKNVPDQVFPAFLVRAERTAGIDHIKLKRECPGCRRMLEPRCRGALAFRPYRDSRSLQGRQMLGGQLAGP